MRLIRWLLALVGVLLVATVAAGAVLVAVEGDSGAEAGSPRSVRPWPRCRSLALGYSIAYPPGWHRDRNCAFFDPKPFNVPENSDFYGTALEVQVAQDSWANVVRGLTDRRYARTISRRVLRVNGRPAVLMEVEANGQGLYERGYRLYGYVVDLRGRPPVIVQATRRPGASWGGRKAVADRAVRSLRLIATARAALPAPVAAKRDAVLAAAHAHDYDALARLVDPRGFTYTYGGPDPGAAEERRQLAPIATKREIDLWAQAGSYYGWRAGITGDGRWIYFVAGD